MQLQITGLHARFDPRVGRQIGQRAADRRALGQMLVLAQRADIDLGHLHAHAGWPGLTARIEDVLKARIQRHRYPAANEIAIQPLARQAAEQGLDAAAVGMTQNHNMVDLKIPHGVLNGGASAIILSGQLVGRYQIGDIAHHEQIPRGGTGQNGRIDAGIATGDQQHLGALPLLGQILHMLRILSIEPFLEPLDALKKPVEDVRIGLSHAGSLSGVIETVTKTG